MRYKYLEKSCTNITTATMPSHAISYIPKNLLTTVVINSGNSIPNSAFKNCTSLTSVVIPDSVTSIGYYAFYNCFSITDVYYTGSEKEWKAISINSYNSDLKGATIHYNYVPKE